jgi:MFS family permease
LLPYLFLLYIIAYLDRVNISFANLEMSKELKFSDSVFGLGAGIFFVGYFLLEIPGAVIVERWSARKWLARIMVSWGIISAGLAFVHTPTQFYVTRFLLGVAEAGFFPGLIIYLTHWFRNADRAKAVALLMAVVPLSQVIGSPISGQLLKITWLGMAGWRWLFIVEGLPAVVFGIVTLYWLTDLPEQARWLPDDEKEWIVGELAREKHEKRAHGVVTILQALRHRDALTFAAIYFFAVTGNYGYQFWLPTILKRGSHMSNGMITLVGAMPFFVGWVAMMINGWHSDKHNERRLHVALPLTLASVAFACAAAASTGKSIPLIIGMFCFVAMGLNSYLPAFWAFATMTLTESAGAAAVGMINSVGNLGGFAGPYAMGWLRDHTSSFAAGIGTLSAGAMISALLALSLKQRTIKG